MWLLALPFSAVGLWMLYSIGSTILEARAMSDWVSVDAQLLDGGLRTSRSDDSTTYRAFARYRYDFNGSTFESDRVAIAGGADNIGSFQNQLGSRLRSTFNRGDPVRIYVDPNAPSEAVIDRSIRWGLILFKSVFVLLFGGVGFGLCIYLLKTPARSSDGGTDLAKPWVSNTDWQPEGIYSNAKLGARFALGFAFIWNVITIPLCFVLYHEIVDKDNLPAWIGLVFPLSGLWLIIWAYRQWRDWRRFQQAPLVLDPYPGAIGGNVGGHISLNAPFDHRQEYWVTLSLIRRSRGSDNDVVQKAQWQEKMLAHVEASASGSKIQFLFSVPANLAPSSLPDDDYPRFEWKINLTADLAQGSIDRDYSVPCYASEAQSKAISEFSFDAVTRRHEEIDERAVMELASFRYDNEGQRVEFAAGRNLGLGAVLCLMGLTFGGAGLYMFIGEEARIFGGIFTLTGSLFLIAAIYSVTNSLSVRRNGRLLLTTRRILGLPIRRREISLDSIRSLALDSDFQSSSNGKHRIYYHVNAMSTQGEKIRIGEGFDGRRQGIAAINLLTETLALPSRLRRVAADQATGHESLSIESDQPLR